jgi:nitrite reductase/ring-hydroxylating ferredoxin subunit
MLDGQVVMCPWHAWSWDVTTGENTANGTLKMPCYEVKVEDGQVYVKVI